MSFFPYGDPALAAEPGFHDQPPCGSGSVDVPSGHTLDTMPELIEYFTEYPLAGSSVQSKTASRVMIDLARGTLAEAAQATMIELVSGQLYLDAHGNLKGI